MQFQRLSYGNLRLNPAWPPESHMVGQVRRLTPARARMWGTGADLAATLAPVVARLAAAEMAGPAELRREKSSEMALPTVIGTDGRAARPAFTSAAALARWRPEARPVP